MQYRNRVDAKRRSSTILSLGYVIVLTQLLANTAKETEKPYIWLEECPAVLFPIVHKDIA